MPTYEPRRFYRQKESDVFDVSLLLKDLQSNVNTSSRHWHWDRENNDRDRSYKGRYFGNYNYRKYNGPRNRNTYYRQKESFINNTSCSCSTDSRKSENESTQPTSPASHWSLGDENCEALCFESRAQSLLCDSTSSQEPLVPMEDLESTIEWEIKDPVNPDEAEKENEEFDTSQINTEQKEEESTATVQLPDQLLDDKDDKEVKEEDANTTETVPVPTPRGFSAAFLRTLGKEVERFAEWSQTTREEQIVREEIFRQVQSKITSLWPMAVVVLFGSSACGLALPCSDVDCVVERLPHIDALISYYIEILSRSLVDIGATNIITAPQARVPLLKFLHPSNLWVDITFKVANAERSVELVRGYLSSYPNARPLIMIVKELLRQQGLHSPRYGGLGSYALVLLVVAYLRLLHVYQPSIGCDHYSLGWLLVQFLSYLATHDLQYAFTPGSSEPVQSKSDEDIETRSTFSDSSSNGVSKARAQRLEVRDPLDLKNNVTFSCSNFLLIQVLFGMAVESLRRAGNRNASHGLLSTFVDISRAETERHQWRNATLNRYRPINFHYNSINVAPRFAIASNTSGIRR